MVETKTTELTFARQEIKMKDVPYYGMLKNQIGYIKLTRFYARCSQRREEGCLEFKE